MILICACKPVHRRPSFMEKIYRSSHYIPWLAGAERSLSIFLLSNIDICLNSLSTQREQDTPQEQFFLTWWESCLWTYLNIPQKALFLLHHSHAKTKLYSRLLIAFCRLELEMLLKKGTQLYERPIRIFSAATSTKHEIVCPPQQLTMQLKDFEWNSQEHHRTIAFQTFPRFSQLSLKAAANDFDLCYFGYRGCHSPASLYVRLQHLCIKCCCL